MNSSHVKASGLAVIVVAAAMGAGTFMAAQQSGPVFTEAQANEGRAAYQTHCAGCHLTDLSGAEGPPLAGTNFMSTWGTRTTKSLLDYLSVTMPPGGGPLGPSDYAAITAFILQRNGAAAGTEPLTGTIAVQIATVATGRPVPRGPAATP